MNKPSRFFLLFILVISGFSSPILAQRTLGVVWDLPENETRAINQLQQFKELGISILEIQEIPSSRVWSEIEQQEMHVFGDIGLLFPTTGTFNRRDSAFVNHYQRKIAFFSERSSVRAINLFHYGATDNREFNAGAGSFLNSIPEGRDLPITATASRIPKAANLPVDFFIYDIRVTPANVRRPAIADTSLVEAYLYSPSEELQKYLFPFRTVIRHTGNYPQKPLFVESSWLLAMLDRHPQLEKAYRSISSEEDVVFPVPNERLPNPASSPLPVIVLLIVWGTLAYHYNISPLYRKSLFRYINSHNFFLNDIYQRHFRSALPGITILLQHALLLAAVFFALSTDLWTALGLKSLQFHFPQLFFLTQSSYDLFILVLTCSLLLTTIFILWLSAFHKKVRSVTQIMTLFAWPLQINFVIGTVALTVHLSGGSTYITTSLAALMFIIFAASFVVTATDVSKILGKGRFRYLALTAGVFVVVLAASAGWIIWFTDHFWEVIDLSLQLK